MPSYIDADGTIRPTRERLAPRAELLNEAREIVTKDRNKSYGEPDEDFQRIAAIASAMGFRVLKTVQREDGDTSEFVPLVGSDVSRFMIALKLSRLAWMPMHHDSWLDIAGYAACGYETATLEADRHAASRLNPFGGKGAVIAEEEESGQLLNEELRGLADKAVTGNPTELEERGLILVDHSPYPGAESRAYCWKACLMDQPGFDGHTYAGGCKYRVKQRRSNG